MRQGRLGRRAALGCALPVVAALVLAACTPSASEERETPPVVAEVAPQDGPKDGPSVAPTGEPEAQPSVPLTADPSVLPDFSVADPGPFRGPLHTADVLITSADPLPDRLVRRIRGLDGVAAAMPLSVASLSSNGRTLTIAAIDPGRFRRFTPLPSAQSDEVWSRVAGGEVAVDPLVNRRLEEPRGFLTLGTQQDAPEVHIGAYAPLVRRISAVVAWPRGKQLGMVRDNALLVSTGTLTPSVLTGRMEKVLGSRATLQVLALEFDVDVPQTALLTGTSAAEAVGSFSYTPLADGRVVPDPRWVAANIRTEEVPLLGRVTCHRVMLPQLRAALREVVARGLASEIHPDEFAGCYYPRFIGYDPAKGLSLHSWGIAVDLNVPGNLRGTVGQMDRQVVAIFKRWGFAWGGDWNYTDPMHFELASIVRAG